MKMITNYGNKIIFASNQSLAFTPDNMGDNLKKVICEEQTPQAICASNNLFGITPESVGKIEKSDL